MQPVTDTLDRTLQVIRSSPVIGIDLETTGLDPAVDRIRLLTVGSPTQIAVYECSGAIPDVILRTLEDRVLLAHHAIFDLSFLHKARLVNIPRTICTRLLAQLLVAGEYAHGYPSTSLGSCVKRWLNQHVDKTLQTSDWAGELTADQLDYARRDVEVLFPLLRVLLGEIEKAQLQRVAELELAALPTFVWMSRTGVPVDVDGWKKLNSETNDELKILQEQLDGLAPSRGQAGLFGGGEQWNWDSPKQVAEVFEILGIGISTTCDAQLAQIDHPIASLLRNYRGLSKRLSAFGDSWLSLVRSDGRIYPHWHQIGAVAGRTSCADPNMQQIPRDGGYRACIAAPPGRAIVRADYSQIELRIACKIAGESRMLEAFQRGQDLHRVTAAFMLGKPIEEITPAERQVAKSANFGLIFGMGPRGYRQYARSTYGIDLTEKEAESYHRQFFKAYPTLREWHRRAKTPTRETRTLCGRRRILEGEVSDTWRLNTPVQGTGADGIKLALGELWRQRDRFHEVFPILTVHDEIVLESPEECAQEVGEWLRGIMVSVMSPICDPVPVGVDVVIGQSWAK